MKLHSRVFLFLIMNIFAIAAIARPSRFMYDGLVYKVLDDGASVELAKPISSDYVSDYSSVEYLDIPEFAICSYWSNNGTRQYDTLSVKAIGAYTFKDCLRLKSLSVPKTIKTIGHQAFYGCSGLIVKYNAMNCEDFNYYSHSPFRFCGIDSLIIGPDVEYIPADFMSCNEVSTTKLIFEERSHALKIGEEAFYRSQISGEINFPNGLYEICNGAFTNCQNISSINLPNTLMIIGDYSFIHCTGLNTLTIPFAVDSIGQDAFKDCENIKEINWYAQNCKSTIGYLHNIEIATIGSQVQVLPSCFLKNSKITVISIPSSVKTICNNAFENCKDLTSLTIPNSVTTIGNNAFAGCEKLAQIKLSNSLLSIEDKVFYDCAALQSIKMPNSITSIGASSFWGCISLKDITFSVSIKRIGNCAFGRCSNINSIILPDSVETLGHNLFYQCGISSITLPSSITYIGSQTLGNGIKNIFSKIVHPLNVIMENDVFYLLDFWESYLYVPAGSLAEYQSAPQWNNFRNIVAPASAINLDQSNISIKVDETRKLVASSDGSNQIFTWSSSNDQIASVNNEGLVTGKGVGVAYISAKTTDGTGLIGTCRVSVEPILITSISFNKNNVTMYCNDSTQLIANIKPTNASIKTLIWTTSDENVATVDQEGNIHAINIGVATITTHTTDGSNLSAHCNVIVNARADSIILNRTHLDLCINDTFQLNATILPDYANNSLNWWSNNPYVATISNTGVITAKNIGIATIFAEAVDGSCITASCEVTVLPDYIINVPELVHIRGSKQCSSSYKIELINNKSAISAMQFDMTLPTGLSMAMSNGYPDVWLDDARKTRTHSVEVNEIGTNTYRFIISSSTNRDLNGNSGDLVHMNLVFDTIHPSGNYYIYLNNIVLTENNETEHRLNYVKSLVKLQYLLGDANADATVDVADYVATAARILNKPTTVFYQDAANVNGDGNLNVTDLVGITNIALGVRDTEIRPAPTIGESYCPTPVVHTTAIDNNVVSFSLYNEMPIAGMQMDLILPEGMAIQEATLQGRAKNHQLSISTLANGHIRLLISAFNDYDIMPGESDILNIALGSASGTQTEIIGQSIIATTRELTTYEINPVNLPLDVSCIGKMNSCNEVRIYTENGHIIIESPSAGTAQLVMVNGITRTLTVNSGQNVYQAERGYYIVRYNGQTAKVKL